MKVTINDKEITLARNEVRSCRRLIGRFIEVIRKKADEERQPTYFFTFLVMLHVMSGKYLNEYDTAVVKFKTDAINKNRSAE